MVAYIKLFWQEDCPQCGHAKEICNRLIEKRNHIPVKLFNITTIDGMTEAAFHEVLSTPTTIIVDDKENEIQSWRGQSPTFNELDENLNALQY